MSVQSEFFLYYLDVDLTYPRAEAGSNGSTVR